MTLALIILEWQESEFEFQPIHAKIINYLEVRARVTCYLLGYGVLGVISNLVPGVRVRVWVRIEIVYFFPYINNSV